MSTQNLRVGLLETFEWYDAPLIAVGELGEMSLYVTCVSYDFVSGHKEYVLFELAPNELRQLRSIFASGQPDTDLALFCERFFDRKCYVSNDEIESGSVISVRECGHSFGEIKRFLSFPVIDELSSLPPATI